MNNAIKYLGDLISCKCGSNVFIASHRGRFNSAIIENTVNSFESAFYAGADVIEVDVAKTKDDKFILLHDPDLERITTGKGRVIDHTFDEIRSMNFKSYIGEITKQTPNSLDEVLEHFKNKCLINLDRCWNYFDPVFDIVKKHKMEDQIILKSPESLEYTMSWLESRNYEPAFMPIISSNLTLASVFNNNGKANVPAVELVFETDTSELIQTSTIEALHSKNIKVWLNAITLASDLAGGHDDTVSILGNAENGWGWLVSRGADIIQTDWVFELNKYLNSFGKRQMRELNNHRSSDV